MSVTTTAAPQCNESTWTDVKKECGACKVLTKSMDTKYGGRCDSYCAAQNRDCVSSSDDLADSCLVMKSGSCSTVWPDTSDAICQCSITTRSTTAKTSTTTASPLLQCDASKTKSDCGDASITAASCVAKGCCWQPTSISNAPWCFYKVPSTSNKLESCDANGPKAECGFNGINQAQCETSGCCWAQSSAAGVPWCYGKNSHTLVSLAAASTPSSLRGSSVVEKA